MTLSIPTGFKYVEVIGESNQSDSREPTATNSNGGVTWTGEDSDISAYVQCYFFNEKSGQLTIKLRNECVLTADKSDLNVTRYDYNSNQSVFGPIDAVLNRLAMSTFTMPANGKSETFSLLNGSSTAPKLSPVPGWDWSKIYYDKEKTKRIDFAKIHNTAFDKSSYQLSDKGNGFTITLKDAYKNHPGVLFALHDVLEHSCCIARRFETLLQFLTWLEKKPPQSRTLAENAKMALLKHHDVATVSFLWTASKMSIDELRNLNSLLESEGLTSERINAIEEWQGLSRSPEQNTLPFLFTQHATKAITCFNASQDLYNEKKWDEGLTYIHNHIKQACSFDLLKLRAKMYLGSEKWKLALAACDDLLKIKAFDAELREMRDKAAAKQKETLA